MVDMRFVPRDRLSAWDQSILKQVLITLIVWAMPSLKFYRFLSVVPIQLLQADLLCES
jgi:hypothetical protein